MSAAFERITRPGRVGRHDVLLDILWLLGLGLLLIATGIGLRDPWPADEPRFALIARDMVATGDWLIPQVGGDVYADKPPLFFWIVSVCLLLAGSLRWAILLPGALAGLGVIFLIYDLARRLWNRDVAFAAGLALLATVQFVWQARQGQIDATLCFFTTLSLYGLLRHLLLGPAWRWYFIGWAAAGFGIITKGVGFLPLLILAPYALLRSWRAASPASERARWRLGPLALLAAVSVWLAPMLLAAAHDPVLAAYRDEILFGQTIGRYANAGHHKEPVWYFALQVMPFFWLPLIALVPWFWAHWGESIRARDLRIALPLAWVLIVLVFFSLSSGKRGLYILPAVPAFVLACAPFIHEVARRRAALRTVFGVACALAGGALAGAIYLLLDAARRQTLTDAYDLDFPGPLFAIGAAGVLVCLLARPRRAFAAFAGVLAAILLVVSFWVNPAMNATRSGAQFIRNVERLAVDIDELGVVAYKEQYLLHITRPVVNFGHARWREYKQEIDDAAAWLAAGSMRALLVDERARARCFAEATARDVGVANRTQWFIVRDEANPECVARGRLDAARTYAPPMRKKNSPR